MGFRNWRAEKYGKGKKVNLSRYFICVMTKKMLVNSANGLGGIWKKKINLIVVWVKREKLKEVIWGELRKSKRIRFLKTVLDNSARGGLEGDETNRRSKG